MITNGKPFKKLSEIFYQYVELFNLDQYRGPPRFSFNQGMSIIDNVVTFLLTWGEETRGRTGRKQLRVPNCFLISFVILVTMETVISHLGISN